MAITYKLWKKKFKNAENVEQEKYLACKYTQTTLSTKDVAGRIVEASSLTEGDVLACLSQLSWVLKTSLVLGHNVTLDGIGTFSISLTSNKIDSRKDLSKLRVWAKRVVFRQDPKLKEILEDLHFKYISIDPLKDEIDTLNIEDEETEED